MTVHEYTQLRAELTAVVLAASTPLVVVGQVVLTLRGPHELLHVAAHHEHDGVVEQVVRGEPSSKGKTPHCINMGHSRHGADSRIILGKEQEEEELLVPLRSITADCRRLLDLSQTSSSF